MNDELILEDFMPYRLARLASAVSRRFSKTYDDAFGISIPEWRVIAVLGRFPGLSAAEVAEQTFLDKVAVSRAVSKLLDSGRIDRQLADADRRRSILNLSEKGRKLHDEVARVALAFERDLLDGLEDSELEQLNAFMDKLLERAMRDERLQERAIHSERP
jgi:DNA-binding MarR family transcriptional regulator